MKYFAHYTAAHLDPKLNRLFEEQGYLGTGLYWRLCEVVCGMKKDAGDTPEYRFSPKEWAERMSYGDETTGKRTQYNARTPRKLLLFLAELGLIEAREESGAFIIKIPKLNNYTTTNLQRRLREQTAESAGQPAQKRGYEKKGKEKDLKAASPAPALGAGPLPQDVNVEEDPETRAQTLKNLKAMAEQIFKPDKPKAEGKAVESSRSEEPDKPGQPKTVDPQLEQELVLTRADIVSHGIDPARANQIITLLAEYHSGRMEAHQLSTALDGVVTCHEKVALYEVDGVIERRA